MHVFRDEIAPPHYRGGAAKAPNEDPIYYASEKDKWVKRQVAQYVRMLRQCGTDWLPSPTLLSLPVTNASSKKPTKKAAASTQSAAVGPAAPMLPSSSSSSALLPASSSSFSSTAADAALGSKEELAKLQQVVEKALAKIQQIKHAKPNELYDKMVEARHVESTVYRLGLFARDLCQEALEALDTAHNEFLAAVWARDAAEEKLEVNAE